MPGGVSSDAEFCGNARFELIGRLGAGAMGVVYDVLDRERDVRMALKGLRAPAAEGVLRLKAEFRALRDLDHPNLLRLRELFEDDGRWFFTMDRVDGEDLLAYVRAQASSDAQTLDAGSSSPTRRSVARSREASRGDTIAEATRVEGRPVRSGSASGEVPISRERSRSTPPEDVVYDEARLRSTLVQLTLALEALHRAGMIHRDVKSSNVLVDASGRVVLLDFGVVAELSAPALDQEGTIVGTASHMAPEQAAGERVGPAADWYAVGTVLYEALTGRLPFEGTMAEILAQKVAGAAPVAPVLIVPSTPADLNALCLRLLAREAAARPLATEMLHALGVSPPGAMLAPHPSSAPFVGRTEESRAIAAAYERVRGGEAAQVFVEGASGIGKSALVSHAVEALRDEADATVVLRGRCHENETVPYNAFDGVIDDLSRVLRTLPEAHGIAFPPVKALLRVFPSLASVPELADAAGPESALELGAVELRQRAFDELRELVRAVTRRRPVIAVIDDVHWADAESLMLLGEWTRAPAPPTLLVATARPNADDGHCAALASANAEAVTLRLGGLSEHEARALVGCLVTGTAPPSARNVDAILVEAGGHPMFLEELLAYSGERPAAGNAPHLDDALLSRIEGLPGLAQRALEAIAASGLPIREAVLAEVLEAPRTALEPQLLELRAGRLVRSAGARLGDALEPYHDRVREAVYGHLLPEGRRALHRRLGALLEKEEAPPEVLLGHFEKGGEIERAVGHALRAAELAAHALAFERAASLYGYAVRAGVHPPDRERALRTSMADMFLKAGRPYDAAKAFASAAATGTPSPDEAFELRRRAAEQYLMGGYLDEGLEVSRAVLAHIGESRPDRYLLLIVLALWYMLRLKVSPLVWSSRAAEIVPVAVGRRLDVYWSFGAGLMLLDAVRAGTFTLKGALLCIRDGDDLRIARAISAACFGAAGRGDGALARRLLGASRAAGERAGTDLARFYPELADVGYTFIIANDSRATLAKCASARARWSRVGHRGGWESDLIEQYEIWSLAALGRISDVVARVRDGVRFARAMGNRFREFMMRTSFPQEYLVRDAPAEGEGDVHDALRSWTQADGRFSTSDYWALKSRCQLASYADDLPRMAALEVEWTRFDRSALGMLELLGVESAELRCMLVLRVALEAKRRGDERALARSLHKARRFLRRLRRSRLLFASTMHLRLEAHYVLVARGPEAARPLFERGLVVLEQEGFAGQVAGMSIVLARIEGGESGRKRLAKARAWAEASGARNAERLLEMVSLQGALLVPPAA